MKVVKQTADYTILQRRDKRYAVQDKARKPILGDDKVKILVDEGLLTVKLPEPEPEAAAEQTEGEAEEEKAEG